MERIELLHLAQRAPALVAVPRVAQICVGNRLHAQAQVEPRGDFIGQRFVLYKPPSRADSIACSYSCIASIPRPSRRAISAATSAARLAKFWGNSPPHLELLVVGQQRLQVLVPLADRSRIVLCCRPAHRKNDIQPSRRTTAKSTEAFPPSMLHRGRWRNRWRRHVLAACESNTSIPAAPNVDHSANDVRTGSRRTVHR